MNTIQTKIAELLAAKQRQRELEVPRFLSENFQPRSPSTHTGSDLNPELVLLLTIAYRINLLDIELLKVVTEWINPPTLYPNLILAPESQLFKTWPLLRIEVITHIDRRVIWTHLIQVLVEAEKIRLDKIGRKS